MDVRPTHAATDASPFGVGSFAPVKPPAEDPRFDMTPMVDLVFMMNIFFLVTWVGTAMAEINLPRARHCAAAAEDRAVVVTITKGPHIFLGNVRPGGELDRAEVERRVTAAVEDGLRQGKEIVLVKAESSVPLRDVAHVAGIASAFKGMKLMLAVTEKK